MKPESLQLVEWHASTPLAGGFTKIDDLTGRVLLYPLAKGEPIIDGQLAAAGAGAGLTAKIPSGMRAISVRSDEVVGVAGFLLPGTHVDVLLTYRSNASPDPRTATVLQDVVVLAAGQQIHPDPNDKPVSVSVVTLLLKPEDAERLVLATTLGTIHFVLTERRRPGAGGRPVDRDQARSPAPQLYCPSPSRKRCRQDSGSTRWKPFWAIRKLSTAFGEAYGEIDEERVERYLSRARSRGAGRRHPGANGGSQARQPRCSGRLDRIWPRYPRQAPRSPAGRNMRARRYTSCWGGRFC